jgi:hypothetical protein
MKNLKSIPLMINVFYLVLIVTIAYGQDSMARFDNKMMIGFRLYNIRNSISRHDTCDLFLYRPEGTNHYYDDDEIVESIGRPFNDFEDCFVPFLPGYKSTKFSEIPGDTIMVLHGSKRYKALIGNIGLYFDECNGITSVCSLAAIDSMPLISDWNDYFLVLRKKAFFDGLVQQYGSYNVSENSVRYLIDSLNANFKENAPVKDTVLKCSDKIIAFAEITQKDPKIIFVTFNCGFDVGLDYSAFYVLIFQNNLWEVNTLQPAENGYHGWQILSSFDINNDGNLEFLIRSIGWEGEGIGIYSSIEGQLKCLYEEDFGGC